MIRSDSVGVLSAKSHQRCFCQRGRLLGECVHQRSTRPRLALHGSGQRHCSVKQPPSYPWMLPHMLRKEGRGLPSIIALHKCKQFCQMQGPCVQVRHRTKRPIKQTPLYFITQCISMHETKVNHSTQHFSRAVWFSIRRALLNP